MLIEKLLFGLIGLCVLALFGVVADCSTGSYRETHVTVIDSLYEPARTGTGVGATGNGGTAVVVTSSGPEYDLVVEFENGQRDIVSTNKATFLAVEKGQPATLRCWHGGISDRRYSCKL